MDKIIKDFPNYTIDDHGRVFSIKSRKYLIPWDGNGYEKVSLRKDRKTFKLFVHRILAEAFLDNPLNLPTVNHINGNRKDNRLENVEWSSYENQELHKNRVINPRSRGSCFFKNGWMSTITVDSKSIYLGRFDTQKEAEDAYYAKYIELRGVTPW